MKCRFLYCLFNGHDWATTYQGKRCSRCGASIPKWTNL